MSASIDVATRGTRSAGRVPLTKRLRSAGVWIVAALAVLLTVIVTMLITADSEPEDPLHYDAVGRGGMKALTETLRTHGTTVTTTEDRDEARRALETPDSTLLIPAGAETLETADIDNLRTTLQATGNRLVLVDPRLALEDFTSRIRIDVRTDPLAQPELTAAPDCPLPAARAAGVVSAGSSEYRAADGDETEVVVCYPVTGPGISDTGDPRGQLVVDSGGDFPLTVLGNPDWLTNGEIDEEGNAALALSTLQQTPNLVIYYPRSDGEVSEAPSTLSYVPDSVWAGLIWLLPCTLVLLLLIGRRFGPLALERLPAIVPAIETVRGRAALSQRSHDRSGALHILRTAALLRIAHRLRLGPEARRAQILTRLSEVTGRDPTALEAVFVTAVPVTDADLTELAALISTIESEVP